MKKHICDRCGKEIEAENKYDQMTKVFREILIYESFCKNCFDKLKKDKEL